MTMRSIHLKLRPIRDPSEGNVSDDASCGLALHIHHIQCGLSGVNIDISTLREFALS